MALNLPPSILQITPYTSERAEDKVVRLLTQVSAYSGRMKMYTVPFTKYKN